MQSELSLEALVNFYQTTRRQNSEDSVSCPLCQFQTDTPLFAFPVSTVNFQLLTCSTINGNYLSYELQLYIFISSFQILIHEAPVTEPRLLTDIQTCRPVVCIHLLEKLQVHWPHNFEHVKQVLRKKSVINLNLIKGGENCIYFSTIVQYKPTKYTFSKLIFYKF
jgi:hypothetical protein